MQTPQPDIVRCEARYSTGSFLITPRPIARCSNKPLYIAWEKNPIDESKDARSISLCGVCAENLKQAMGQDYATLVPIVFSIDEDVIARRGYLLDEEFELMKQDPKHHRTILVQGQNCPAFKFISPMYSHLFIFANVPQFLATAPVSVQGIIANVDPKHPGKMSWGLSLPRLSKIAPVVKRYRTRQKKDNLKEAKNANEIKAISDQVSTGYYR